MKRILLVLALLLFCLPMALAVKPDKQSSVVMYDTSLAVVVPHNTYLLYDAPIEFKVHVYNASGYSVASETDCELEIYNSTGEYFIESNMNYNSTEDEFSYNIGATVFTHKGTYPYLVSCNSTAQRKGGFYSSYLEILPYEPINDARSKMYLSQTLLGIFLVTTLFTLGQVMKEQHAPFKMFLTWLGFIGILPVINFGLQLAELYAVSQQVIDMLTTFYYIGWAVMLFSSVYFGIYLLTWALSKLNDSIQNPFRRK